MNITSEIAEQIFDKTKEILGKKLVLTNDKGIIVTGGQQGNFNLYAYQAISQKRVVEEEGDKTFI